MFDQAPVSMQLLAADGRTIQVNKAWEALWQVSDGDGIKDYVLGSEYNVLADPQLDKKGITPFLRRAFAGESVLIPPIYYDTKELGNFGRPRWVTGNAQPIKDKLGRVQEVMLMHEDITDRITSESLTRESEERFRSLVTATSQITWIAAPDGRIIEDSPSWREFTGQTYDEWKESGWLDAIHFEDREYSAKVWAESVNRKHIYQVEYRVRRADGQYRWTSVRGVPILNPDGTIREWMGANTDIHEVRLAQAALAKQLETEKRYAVLLGKVANASRVIQSALSVDEIAQALLLEVRDILEVHQAVVSLTEAENWSQSINAASLSEKYAHFRSYDAKTDGTGIYAEVCRTNKAMRLTQAELELHPAWKGFGVHADKHPAMRGWVAVPLIGQNGKNIGLIQASDKHEGEFTEEDEAILTQLASIAANGFENARLYSSLQEQDRRKDEFLAMLAHELRNPLAPISAAAELLSHLNLDKARIKRTVDVISRQVKHMTGLVDDLLDVSRVTRGLISLNKTDVDIKSVVADAVEQVRPLVEAKGHYLTVESAPEPMHVLGDQKRLVQVMTNLLHNAAKYTLDGGSIRIRLEALHDSVLIHVMDNGIGIASELQPHIFELFSQAERTSDRSQGGLGIGLALVKSLIGLHDGDITLISDGIGGGCTFTVSFPGAPDKGASAEKPDVELPISSQHRKLRVLVVDDNIDAAEMLSMYLQVSGHEVLVEHSSKSALERARSELPDVCMLDIGLPEMDGNELARRLRTQPETANAVLVAITGYGQERDRGNAENAGFDHYFVKPMDTSKLASLLSKISNL